MKSDNLRECAQGVIVFLSDYHRESFKTKFIKFAMCDDYSGSTTGIAISDLVRGGYAKQSEGGRIKATPAGVALGQKIKREWRANRENHDE